LFYDILDTVGVIRSMLEQQRIRDPLHDLLNFDVGRSQQEEV
jgi:hypothetical protein